MTDIDTAMVKRIAKLANLHIEPDELESVRGDLEKIIGIISHVQDVNTEGVEPLFNVLEKSSTTRPDVVQPSDSVETALQNAPRQESDLIVTPRVVE